MTNYLKIAKDAYQEDERNLPIDLLYSFLSPYLCLILLFEEYFEKYMIVYSRNKLNSIIKEIDTNNAILNKYYI
jgi:hypothetical protein